MKHVKPVVISFCLLLALSISLNISANTPDKSLNQVMTEIGHTMELLFPVLFDSKKPDDPETKKQLDATTKKISGLFKEAKPHFDIKSPAYRISFHVIEKQLSDAKVALKYGNIKHAKNIYKEFISICSSCHTQDTKLRTLFSDTGRKKFGSDLQFAEFNYMTRNYEQALTYYIKHLDASTAMSEAELMTIMKRILTIYTQIYNKPEDAIAQLSKLKKHPAHTKFSRKNLDEWLAGLEDLKEKKYSKRTNPNIGQLIKYVDEILGPLHEPGSAEFPSKKEKVARIWLRGRLFGYLNTHPPKDEIPEILYWLAIIDRSIDYSFYYSLADMYLKECMLQYISHPYAKKCYEEYESYIVFSYSGSRGTDIPDEIENELKALKVRVFSAPKQ